MCFLFCEEACVYIKCNISYECDIPDSCFNHLGLHNIIHSIMRCAISLHADFSNCPFAVSNSQRGPPPPNRNGRVCIIVYHGSDILGRDIIIMFYSCGLCYVIVFVFTFNIIVSYPMKHAGGSVERSCFSLVRCDNTMFSNSAMMPILRLHILRFEIKV